MDLVAERAGVEPSQLSVVEGSRRNFAWSTRTFTVAMMLVFAAVAIVGMQTATAYVERESSMTLISSGGPTTIEREALPEPTPEPGTGVVASPALSEAEKRGLWALQQIGYPWQEKLPGWTVEFEDGRDGLFGLTLVEDQRIEIYVRDDQPDDLLVHIVAHELGHAVDVTLNSGKDRRAWQAARGIEHEPWWPDSAASDFRTGAGDFAESFAYWQAESDNFRSKLGPAPSPYQLELMAKLAVN